MCPRVLGTAGSLVEKGNMEILIREALNAAKEEEVEIEYHTFESHVNVPCFDVFRLYRLIHNVTVVKLLLY